MLPIESSVTMQLFAMPSGKPDPKGSASTRVIQAAQKGPTCYYYAMNMLRRRIGPAAGIAFEKERNIEVLFSKRRKDVTNMRHIMAQEKALAFELGPEGAYNSFNAWHKAGATFFLSSLTQMKKNTSAPLELFVVSSLIEEFLSQDMFENLLDYVEDKHNKLCIESGLEFLSKLSLSAECMYNDQLLSPQAATAPTWESLDLYSKRAHVENFCFQEMFRSYKLRTSPWRPVQGIEGLLACLKSLGPMYIKGMIGKQYFELPPTFNQDIHGLQIFSFDESKFKAVHHIFHSIVVTGVDLSGKAIFYIDPSDASDPSKEVFRKTYVISYDYFISTIGDLKNNYVLDKSLEGPLSSPYGLHAP